MTDFAVYWLGQSGFLYRFPSGTVVCVDPYLSHAASGGRTRERLTPIPLPASQLHADLVITTHDHVDHFDEITLRPIAESRQMLFAGPASCREHWLAMDLPGERFLRLDQGDSLQIMDVALRATYADHSSGNKRDAIGVVMEAGGLRIYQVGDSEYNQTLVDTVKDLQPDLMTVPINGRAGNMGSAEAADLVQVARPQVVIPNHYGMFRHNTADPQDFVDACAARQVPARVAILKVGRWIEFRALFGKPTNEE